MTRRHINIMIIPPSTDRVREYVLPSWLAYLVIAGGTVAVLVVFAATFLTIGSWRQSNEDHERWTENAALHASLSQMQERVLELQEQVNSLENAEKSVRMVFGMPDIDPDERALGIGGGVLLAAGELSLTPALADAQRLEAMIDRLLSRCEFERDNYDDVMRQLVDRKDRLDHTPSIRPTEGYRSRGFGVKVDPFTGRKRMHQGIDIAGPTGTPIYAVADGRISVCRWEKKFGNMITIDHGYGVQTRYGHLSKFAVKRNARVKRGELIGFTGNSGYSTGPHLHYEVRVDGRAVNPNNYIYDNAPQPSAPVAMTD